MDISNINNMIQKHVIGCGNSKLEEWANNWLDGYDRTYPTAKAAHAAKNFTRTPTHEVDEDEFVNTRTPSSTAEKEAYDKEFPPACATETMSRVSEIKIFLSKMKERLRVSGLIFDLDVGVDTVLYIDGNEIYKVSTLSLDFYRIDKFEENIRGDYGLRHTC
jgi:hypothetical protein